MTNRPSLVLVQISRTEFLPPDHRHEGRDGELKNELALGLREGEVDVAKSASSAANEQQDGQKVVLLHLLGFHGLGRLGFGLSTNPSQFTISGLVKTDQRLTQREARITPRLALEITDRCLPAVASACDLRQAQLAFLKVCDD